MRGRGAETQPANRFEQIHIESDFEHLAIDDPDVLASRQIPTEYFVDESKTVVSQNDSPDIGFNYSINSVSGLRARLRILLRSKYTRIFWAISRTGFRVGKYS